MITQRTNRFGIVFDRDLILLHLEDFDQKASKNAVTCWKSWADERAVWQTRLNLIELWDQAYPHDTQSLTQVWETLHGDMQKANEHIILTVCASAGGEEAAYWSEELVGTFIRFAEKNGWDSEIIDTSETGCIVRVEGEGASGFESQKGVHRFVRQSPFDKNQKVHTSFVEVGVSYDLPDDEISVHKKDVRVDVMRSSGAGGQHVNKTESAVRLTHEPTGLVAICRKGRSQHTNKKTAWSLLIQRVKDHSKRGPKEHKQIGGWGEKNFTYHAGRDSVVCHGSGQTVHGLKSYMQGRIDLMGFRTALLSDTNKPREP